MQQTHAKLCCRAQAGIALLATLWILTLLILLSLLLSRAVQLETRTTRYRKEAAQAYALARGGIETVIAELAFRRPQGEESKRSPLHWQPGQRGGTLQLEEGVVQLEIVNETGKLDLNTAGGEQLRRLFEARNLESTAAQQLARRVLHWRTPASSDPEMLALDNYYLQQGRGERPRHAAFPVVEEVLRVRGMSRDIFYGTGIVTEEGKIEPRYGVGADLTVFSKVAQVNPNYASEAVLRSVPGIEPVIARVLIRERAREPFRSTAELQQRVHLPSESLPFLTLAESGVYSITARARVGHSRVQQTVQAVVQMGSPDGRPYRILRWYDDYSGIEDR